MAAPGKREFERGRCGRADRVAPGGVPGSVVGGGVPGVLAVSLSRLAPGPVGTRPHSLSPTRSWPRSPPGDWPRTARLQSPNAPGLDLAAPGDAAAHPL